jgi:tRNA(Ile)-lysidine synthase
LETFNPRIREVILRSAAIISADYDYLRAQSAQAWTEVAISESEQVITFDLEKWRRLPLAMQRSTIREAIHRLRRSLRNINWVHVEDAIRVLQEGTTGMAVTLPRRLQARLGYDRFDVADEGYAAPLPDMPLLHEEVPLRIPGRTRLPGSEWQFTARLVRLCDLQDGTLRPASPWQAYLDYEVAGKNLSLRPRRTGDRFWPQGLGDKPTTVHNFMTNVKLPRAWRDAIPLLVSPSQVLWIAGWRIDERAKVTGATERVLVLAFEKRRKAAADANG